MERDTLNFKVLNVSLPRLPVKQGTSAVVSFLVGFSPKSFVRLFVYLLSHTRHLTQGMNRCYICCVVHNRQLGKEVLN